MTTRRDLMKLAAALGLTGTIPTNAERAAAADVLNVPIATSAEHDPATFAEKLDRGWAEGDFRHAWWEGGAAASSRKLYDLQQLLESQVPELKRTLWPLWFELDCLIGSMELDAYNAGLHHGAAYEHLRRALYGVEQA